MSAWIWVTLGVVLGVILTILSPLVFFLWAEVIEYVYLLPSETEGVVWWMRPSNYERRWDYTNKWGQRARGVRIKRLVISNGIGPRQLAHPNPHAPNFIDKVPYERDSD